MTVKKAIEILVWICHKKQVDQLKEKWYSGVDVASEVDAALLESERTEISNLEKIRIQLVPNCHHPKKMRDKITLKLFVPQKKFSQILQLNLLKILEELFQL